MSLETLIADPEFQAQDIEVKRQILTAASPKFKARSLEDQNLVLNDLPQLEPKTPAAPKTSPISEQEAFKQQFIRQGTQTIPEQVLGALTAPARAGAGLATGLADILYKGAQGVGSMAQKAADARELALSQPGFFNRLRALAGEQVGQIGDVLQTAGEVGPRAVAEGLNAARQGFFQSPQATDRTGRSIVAATNPLQGIIRALVDPQTAPTQAQAQQAFEENVLNQAISQSLEQPILQAAQEAAGLPVSTETNVDVARAAPLLIGAEVPLAAGVRALASPVQTSRSLLRAVAPKVAARTAPATVEQSAMAALDVTAEEAARHVPIVSQRVLEIQKAPKTASEALKAANTAEASLYQDALVADKAATQQGLAPRSDLIMNKVEETLNNIPTLLPEERLSLLQDARARYSDVSTTAKGRALQQRLNKEFEAQYANDTFDRAAPANEVKLAVRNSIAEQMDEINKAVTGVDAAPYSDIGSLIEFKGNLGKSIQRIEGAEARAKTGLASTKPSRLPTSKIEVATQVKRSLLSPLQKTQLEKLDKNVSRLFTEGKKAATAPNLAPEVQQALIQKYGAQPTPPPLPVVEAPIIPELSPPPIPSLTFEEQIQALIETYPPSFRRDPAMARAAAIGQLQGAPPVQ